MSLEFQLWLRNSLEGLENVKDFCPQPFLVLYKGIHAKITGQENRQGTGLVNLEPQVLFSFILWHGTHYRTIRKAILCGRKAGRCNICLHFPSSEGDNSSPGCCSRARFDSSMDGHLSIHCSYIGSGTQKIVCIEILALSLIWIQINSLTSSVKQGEEQHLPLRIFQGAPGLLTLCDSGWKSHWHVARAHIHSWFCLSRVRGGNQDWKQVK